MNYTEKAKEEILHEVEQEPKFWFDFLCAVTKASASISVYSKGYSLDYEFKDESLALYVASMLKSQFNVEVEFGYSTNDNSDYTISIQGKDATDILKQMNMSRYEDGVFVYDDNTTYLNKIQSRSKVSAFMQGLFVTIGSVYFPSIEDKDRGYHIELNFIEENYAESVKSLLEQCDIQLSIVDRTNSFALYSKNNETVSDFMALVKAMGVVLDLNEVSIRKGINNQLNRESNIMAHNLDKIFEANAKYIHAIEYIQKTVGLDYLEDKLENIAKARLEDNNESMQELAVRLNITKSSLNRALNKIIKIQEELIISNN